MKKGLLVFDSVSVFHVRGFVRVLHIFLCANSFSVRFGYSVLFDFHIYLESIAIALECGKTSEQ